MPQVVGITVHLTFARRAFELADWYRAPRIASRFRRAACAVVSRRMRAARGCACARRRRAALAAHSCRHRSEQPSATLRRYLRKRLLRRSFAAALDSSAPQLPHHYQPDRHSRMPQPLRLLLSRDRRPAHAVSHEAIRNRSPPSFWRTISLTPFSSTTISARAATIFTQLCAALRPLNKIWSAAVTIDVTDDPSLIRNMALAGCTGVFIGFESLSDQNLADAHKKTPKTSRLCPPRAHPARLRHSGEWIVRARLRPRPQRCPSRARPNGSKKIASNAQRFTSSRRIPRPRCFNRWRPQGRILHRDWTLYDTGHAVFRPKHMTPEELEQGYAWIYQRLFSHSSIWRRRPEDWQASRSISRCRISTSAPTASGTC